MSKSLAELRQSPRVGLPERTYSLCLASKLVSEVQSLWAQLVEAEQVEEARREGDAAAPPRRNADKPESIKIRKKIATLQAEMTEHTGNLRIVGVPAGEWEDWVDHHPPRENNDRDLRIADGICNADDLLADLGKYAKAWNGDDLGEGDWEWLKSNAAPGDIKAIARTVVRMHEGTVDVPKLLSNSLGILDESND